MAKAAAESEAETAAEAARKQDDENSAAAEAAGKQPKEVAHEAEPEEPQPEKQQQPKRAEQGKAKEQEKEAHIAGLFATLRACKPADEVLPLINKATATQKDEVPL